MVNLQSFLMSVNLASVLHIHTLVSSEKTLELILIGEQNRFKPETIIFD